LSTDVASTRPVEKEGQEQESSHKESGPRRAKFTASKKGSRPVQEQQQTLEAYMSLPASQYSVLDARKIERISDTSFRCYVGQLRMMSWEMEPVLTVSVEAEPGLGCTIRLTSCQLKGSPAIEAINDKFTAQMTNVVRWRDSGSDDADAADKAIESTTSLMVELEVPRWCAFLPTASIEGVGAGVLQNVLNVMVPRFLAQLATDYGAWASGDTSRKPVGEM